MTSQEALAIARAIILQAKMGVISYDEAKAKCEPYFKIANKRIAEIAKKHNKKPFKMNFYSFRRS